MALPKTLAWFPYALFYTQTNHLLATYKKTTKHRFEQRLPAANRV